MSAQRETPSTDKILMDGLPLVKTEISNGVQVTVRLPENIPETVRQRKINRIFDILTPSSSM